MFNSIGKSTTNVLILTVLFQLSNYLAPQYGSFISYFIGALAGAIVMGINVATNTNKEGDK